MTATEKLSPRRRLMIGTVAFVLAASGFTAGRALLRPVERVPQPIQFNHQKHVQDVGLECSMCHEYFGTSEHSGLPSLSVCELCHIEALTESPEEQTLLQLIAAEGPRPEFHKLFRMPDHVYYSHRRHVGDAGLACEVCHGPVADTTAPPAAPLVRITMDTCVDCHEERGVQTNCTACHR